MDAERLPGLDVVVDVEGGLGRKEGGKEKRKEEREGGRAGVE